MRISDWSSDVCSSDLNMHRAEPGDGFLEHRLNVLLVGDVGGDCGGATAFAFDLPDYLGRRSVISRQMVHDHGGLRAAERDCARSEEHTSELQSLMRISYAVFCLKKKKNKYNNNTIQYIHTQSTH